LTPVDSLQVLVVDDEPLARRKLRRFLEAEPGVRCAGECGTGEQAIARIQAGGIDVVLLDIQMPGVSGLEVVEQVGAERMPSVVFVTAHDRYAVRAFDVHAVDYLLKPFDRERFRVALRRTRLRHRAFSGSGAGHRPLAGSGEQTAQLTALLRDMLPRGAGRVAVRKAGGVVFVALGDVDWIESQGNYVALHVGRETHLVRDSLGAFEGRLDPRRFARVRRTAIVNLGRVAALRPWEKDEHVVLLQSGARIPVSQPYRRPLEQALAGGGGA
jgi:two-component system, LytTR family, response regulator